MNDNAEKSYYCWYYMYYNCEEEMVLGKIAEILTVLLINQLYCFKNM